MKIIIKNGFLVSESFYGVYDIEIENNKIIKVKKNIPPVNHIIYNAKNKIIFPGIIDAHTHFKLKGYGSETIENFYTGTKTALCSGITTIIDYIIPQKKESLVTAFYRRSIEAKNCWTDYSFHSQIVDWDSSYPKQINKIISSGIKSFKIFLPKTEHWYINDEKLKNILNELSKYENVVLEAHCEDSDVIENLVLELKEKRKLSVKYFPYSRPNIAEDTAVQRFINIAKNYRCNIYIVHISTKEAIERIIQSRKNKNKLLNIYAETCPQYLTFTNKVFNKANNYLYTCCPPIKSHIDREYLWKCIKTQNIDVIATDNCVFSKKIKFKFRNDFTKIPMGLPGITSLLYSVITHGRKRKIGLRNLIKMLTSNPAKIFGLYPKKGDLIPNKSDADIIIFDPKKKWTFDFSNCPTVADYSPYQGMNFDGKIETVIFKGKPVLRNGNFIANMPYGNFIKR